jgi:hypothetical protein
MGARGVVDCGRHTAPALIDAVVIADPAQS